MQFKIAIQTLICTYFRLQQCMKDHCSSTNISVILFHLEMFNRAKKKKPNDHIVQQRHDTQIY